MIEFKRKFSMVNGNKVNKKNWHKVVAVSSQKQSNVHGISEIDRQIKEKGAYYEKWKLVYEKPNDLNDEGGYIFREINHNGGISGRHKTYRKAIWYAISNRISVFIEE